MAIKLTISSKEILNKVFAKAPRGYNSLEVDQFLDEILRDYRLIESNHLVETKEIDSQKETIKALENRIKELEIENAKYEARFKNIKDNKNVTVENIDLYKRISVLEKYIYNTGVDPKTIK